MLFNPIFLGAVGAAYNSAGQAYPHTSYSNAAATTVANQDQKRKRGETEKGHYSFNQLML